MPGWEEHSWGYHGDDGHLFSGPGTSKPYGPKFGTGDIIGCGFDFRTMSSFYTKNGVYLGIAFENVTGRSIFPFVGFKTPGERLRANFGQHDFKFDIAQYYKDEKRLTLNKVLLHRHSSNPNNDTITTKKKRKDLGQQQRKQQNISSSSSSSSSNNNNNSISSSKNSHNNGSQQYHQQKQLQDQVVLDYLLHHGYARSASMLRRSINNGDENEEQKQHYQQENNDAQSRSGKKNILLSISYR